MRHSKISTTIDVYAVLVPEYQRLCIGKNERHGSRERIVASPWKEQKKATRQGEPSEGQGLLELQHPIVSEREESKKGDAEHGPASVNMLSHDPFLKTSIS